jgi:hypothetical protein
VGHHYLALPSEVGVLIEHLPHLVVEVFQFVGPGYVARSVHAPAAMHEHYFFAPFLVDLLVEVRYKVVNIVDVDKAGHDVDGRGDDGVVVEGVEDRPKDNFTPELTCLWMLFEKLLLNVAIFSLFGGEEVEEGDDH